MKRFLASVVVSVLCVGVIEAVVAQSRDAQPSADAASIQRVVDEICSDGGAWLRCYSLDPAKCRSITAGFVDPCVRRVIAKPSQDPNLHPLAQMLGCFNEEFMSRYGAGEVKTPECANPMKHLMGAAN
jgi:hypothetical protein